MVAEKTEHSPFGFSSKEMLFFLVITSSPSNMLLFRSVLSSTSNRPIGCRKVFLGLGQQDPHIEIFGSHTSCC